MVAPLVSLPNDVLLEILKSISSSDLISLNLTCRALHTICSNDSLWRYVTPPLPLDIPVGKNLRSLNGSQIRELHLKAIHLDKTLWSLDPDIQPNPTKVVTISRPSIVSEVEFLSSDWLVILSPVSGVVFELWSLVSPGGSHEACWTCVSSMTTNLQYPSNIAAAWTKCGREALVATYAWTQSGSCLHVYTFSKISPSNVESDEWKASLGIVVDDVSGSGAYRGITSSTQIVQHMVGIVATRRPDNNAEGTQVWVYLVNSVTKRSYSTRVHAFEFFSKFPVLHISPDLRYFLLIVGHYGAQDNTGDHREGVKDSMPSQFIQVYRIPPEVSFTHSHEDTVVPDNMGPLVISTSKLFDSIPMAQYRTSPTITPSANISLLQGDTYLDSLNVLHIFQPCVKGQGAYVARFSIDIDSGRKTITQTYCSLIAIDLICRSQFVSTPACMVSRGLFYAEVRLPDGLAKKLFRYRLPTDLENQVNTLRSRNNPATPAVSSLDIQDVNDPEGDAPITFAYDEASGRICQSSVGGQDEERVYRLTIADMV